MRTGLILVFSFLALLPVPSFSAPIGTTHYDEPKPAPGFVLTDLKSDTHRLTDYQGEVLIVSFWATWCTPCIKELPSLARTADLLRDDNVRVVAINVGESTKDIKRFLARSPSDLVFLPDAASKVGSAWDVRALPTAYVVDKQGRIAIRVIGGLEWDTDAMLQDLRKLARQ